MAGHDIQNVNETKTTKADAAMVTAIAVGAHEPDTVEPDGGELAAAMVYFYMFADPKS